MKMVDKQCPQCGNWFRVSENCDQVHCKTSCIEDANNKKKPIWVAKTSKPKRNGGEIDTQTIQNLEQRNRQDDVNTIKETKNESVSSENQNIVQQTRLNARENIEPPIEAELILTSESTTEEITKSSENKSMIVKSAENQPESFDQQFNSSNEGKLIQSNTVDDLVSVLSSSTKKLAKSTEIHGPSAMDLMAMAKAGDSIKGLLKLKLDAYANQRGI